MDASELRSRLHMEYPVLAIKRVKLEGEAPDLPKGCTLSAAFNQALAGEPVTVTAAAAQCRGARAGFGFSDGLPDIPGGFGNFIAHGAGEGFPAGEKIKCDAATAEQMLLGQPQQVMEGFDAIRLAPYGEGCEADTVAFVVKPDALSALVHLFNFRRSTYDEVIAPMASGCASVFRIPFGELNRTPSRAVIGNIDLFSRKNMDAETFIFVVSHGEFLHMLEDADNCFLQAAPWKAIEKRL